MKKLMIMVCFLAASQLAAQPIAKVLFTKNTVNLSRGGVTSKLVRGKQLKVGDAIITASNSSAQIKYNNGTIVSIGTASNYKILAYSPKQGNVSIKAELRKGKLHSTTTGKSKREELKTPTIAMAILGTDYEVYVPCVNQTACAKETFIQVNSGKVQAGGRILPVGQGVRITPQGMTKTTFPSKGKVAITIQSEATSQTNGAEAATTESSEGTAESSTTESYENNTLSTIEESSTLETTQVIANVAASSNQAVLETTGLLDISVTGCVTF